MKEATARRIIRPFVKLKLVEMKKDVLDLVYLLDGEWTAVWIHPHSKGPDHYSAGICIRGDPEVIKFLKERINQ